LTIPASWTLVMCSANWPSVDTSLNDAPAAVATSPPPSDEARAMAAIRVAFMWGVLLC
jgi:hypothetical protein